MRKLLLATLVACIMSVPAFAQTTPEPKPVVITTFHAAPLPFDDTTFKNYSIDTMIAYYMNKGVRPNTYYKNFRILGHYWGDDSYDVKFIYEVEKWDDINKAEENTTKLIDASFKNEADKKLFWKRWGRLFNRHDDSIMSDWVPAKY